MKHLLIYADSLSWGIVPDTRLRLDFGQRWPGVPVPQILVVAPPAICTPAGNIAPKFEGGDVKCAGLAAAYAQVCAQLGCAFYDAGEVVQASPIDGVHLDAEQHAVLGAALAPGVAALLAG